MNEIQKFKKGRMIPKHQTGGGMYSVADLVEAGNRAFGQALYYDKRTGDLVQIASKDALARDGRVKGEVVRTGAEMQSRPYSVFNITGWKTIGPYQGKIAQKRPLTGKTSINTNEEVAELNKLNSAGTGVKDKKAVVVKQSGKKPINWGKEFTDFMGGLSSEQQNWLKTNGLNDATKLQEYLNNMGFSVGKFGADGKFGNNSKTAWNNFAASGIMGKNRDQEILTEKQQPVIDAPDPFGYESKGNYALDNARTLKTNGIRDWATMLNYIKGNQDSAFSQDMMHRFGSDLSKWKQEDVEGTMGVSGHYGRKDRSRIQGFMAGNQATWNNQRQAAINDYAKKTFLSNPSGANTLGSQPGLSKEWAGTDGIA